MKKLFWVAVVAAIALLGLCPVPPAARPAQADWQGLWSGPKILYMDNGPQPLPKSTAKILDVLVDGSVLTVSGAWGSVPRRVTRSADGWYYTSYYRVWWNPISGRTFYRILSDPQARVAVVYWNLGK